MATKQQGPASPAPDLEVMALASLLDQTAAAVRRHVVMPPAAADITALWIGHTYVYAEFDHTPRLGISSPAPQCGKSTLLDLLYSTCFLPVKADNLTSATVFRTIEAKGTLSLLIDEYDSFLGKDDGLRGILNSGYERSGTVLRTETDANGKRTVENFRTFCPVALAGIRKLPATLADRSVPIALQRKLKDQHIEKFRDNGNRAKLGELRERWMEFWWKTADVKPRERLRLVSVNIPDAFSDRQGDIGLPLLAIADLAGGRWSERARIGLAEAFGYAAMLGAGDDYGLQLLHACLAARRWCPGPPGLGPYRACGGAPGAHSWPGCALKPPGSRPYYFPSTTVIITCLATSQPMDYIVNTREDFEAWATPGVA